MQSLRDISNEGVDFKNMADENAVNKLQLLELKSKRNIERNQEKLLVSQVFDQKSLPLIEYLFVMNIISSHD